MWDLDNDPIPTIKVGEIDGQLIATSSTNKTHKKHYSYTIHEDEGNLKVLKEKGHKSNVWIHKDDDGKHKTKVISEEHTIHFEADDNEEHEMEITIDSEDGDKIKKHKITKKGRFVFLSDDDGEPIYFLNGKEINKSEMEKLDSNSIERMEVLKGSKATEKYGKKAKGGVILITTKKE